MSHGTTVAQWMYNCYGRNASCLLLFLRQLVTTTPSRGEHKLMPWDVFGGVGLISFHSVRPHRIVRSKFCAELLLAMMTDGVDRPMMGEQSRR